MTITIPSYLEPVATIAGCTWPQCDEDALDTMGTHWENMATTLGKIKDGGDEAATSLARHIDGRTHDSFKDYWVGASKHLEELVELCNGLGKACKIMSVLIKAYKLFAIAAMIELGVNLAIAAATAVETLGASAAEAAGEEVVTRVLLRQAVKKLLMQIVKDTVVAAFKGLAKGLAQETGWQIAEKELGLSNGISWKKVGEAGVHSAISSAVSNEAEKALKEVGVDKNHDWNPLTSSGHKHDSTSEHSDESEHDSHDSTHETNKKDQDSKDEEKTEEQKKEDADKKEKFDKKLGKLGDGIADEAVSGPNDNKKRLLEDSKKLLQNQNSTPNPPPQIPNHQSSLNLPPI